MVYNIFTLEGWTFIMISVGQAYNQWATLYFYSIAIIGAFFLINLVMAVLKTEFSRA